MFPPESRSHSPQQATAGKGSDSPESGWAHVDGGSCVGEEPSLDSPVGETVGRIRPDQSVTSRIGFAGNRASLAEPPPSY